MSNTLLPSVEEIQKWKRADIITFSQPEVSGSYFLEISKEKFRGCGLKLGPAMRISDLTDKIRGQGDEIEETDFIKHSDEKHLVVIKDLYQIVTNRNSYSRILMSGASGIGKSCFLLYLLIRLLCNIDDLELNVGTFIEFSDLYEHSETWYMYLVGDTNSTQGIQGVKEKTVVSVSPRNIKKRKTSRILKIL
ncbi:11416_t:CDS:2 [Diversispora eburnea]|uniref:11416_t:CDS:1 n=1 Tax=Diversispora eburnea TaxID=1213867 RepID=A0A9N9C0S4_9GLOM|nr:11416_t:CDS:2 [Diversispora eburnea]